MFARRGVGAAQRRAKRHRQNVIRPGPRYLCVCALISSRNLLVWRVVSYIYAPGRSRRANNTLFATPDVTLISLLPHCIGWEPCWANGKSQKAFPAVTPSASGRPAGAQDIWSYTEIQFQEAPTACHSPSQRPLPPPLPLEPFWIFNAARNFKCSLCPNRTSPVRDNWIAARQLKEKQNTQLLHLPSRRAADSQLSRPVKDISKCN